MAHATEHDVHHNQIVDYLIRPTSASQAVGLGWQIGNPARVDGSTLLIKDDLLAFLAHGNSTNAQAWAALMVDCKRDEALAWEEVKSAFVAASSGYTNHPQLLREGLKVRGHAFTLWNTPPHRTSLHSTRNDFARNTFRVSSEVVLPWTFQAKVGTFRRPDLMFHVNGVYYAFAEVKARQTGQSAGAEGRNKIAGDFREFAYGALLDARAEWERVYGDTQPWPGYGSSKRFPEAARRELQAKLIAHFKAAWIIALDMSEVWMAPAMDSWIAACDESISRGFRDPHMDAGLIDQMLADFTKMPPIASLPGWGGVKAHLSGLLDDKGVAREIALFHFPRTDKTTSQKDFLRPRTPQRVVLERVAHRVDELYAREHIPGWIEDDLRARIHDSMPNLGPQAIEQIVADRLKYRNGQDAHSILIQGAAGLGKTNLAIWIALELYGLQAPLPPGAHPDTQREPLFDRCVILTDRVELRDNVAQEAERTLGTKGQVLLADTQEILLAALTGQPLPKGVPKSNIIVVNLQKFPAIAEAMAKGEVKVQHSSGRTAFIIDEVHRSQNGSLNENATQVFVDAIGELARAGGTRKNLVVGLTATPSDTILARFGEWHPQSAISDNIFWVPYFSYALNQAIHDGYVLDPRLGVVRLAVSLAFKASETIKGAKAGETQPNLNLEKVYEDPERQRLVANNFVKMFASATMQAMPHGHHTVLVGQGKAMITENSIKAAIGMQQAIKDALYHLADESAGMPWERYADILRTIADERVFILYSDTDTGQGEGYPSCASLNPKLNGKLRSEKEIISGFRCSEARSDSNARNSIIVVVDKLLTGFDEPTLHTLMIDRSMRDIGLFQTMCRTNRKTKGKVDSLIIDACHDDTIAKEYPRVFNRYGGLATSDLDGLDLKDRIEAKRRDILANEEVKSLWKAWSKLDPADADGKRELNRKVSEWADAMLLVSVEAASEYRRTVGGYLAGQRLARTLMVLDPRDTNQDGWIDFLREIHTVLRIGTRDASQALEIAFEVERIGLDDAGRFCEEANDETRKHRRMDPSERGRMLLDRLMEDDTIQVNIAEVVGDKVLDLQEQEDEKRKRTEEIRQFVQTMFEKIDQQSQQSNEDEFRRSIWDGSIIDLSHQERLSRFMDLFDQSIDVLFGRKNKGLISMLRRHPELMLAEYRERVAGQIQGNI